MKRIVSFILFTIIVLSAFASAAFSSSAETVTETEEYPIVYHMDTDNPYNPVLVDEYNNEVQTAGLPDNIGTVKRNLVKNAELPSSYDSRDCNYVTSVKNQYATGTCWAHSAVSAIETYDIVNGYADKSANYSEAQIVWFAYNTVSDDGTANDGSNYGTNSYGLGGNFHCVASVLANGSGISNEKTQWEGFSRSSNYPSGIGGRPVFYDEDRYVHSADRRLADASEIVESYDVSSAGSAQPSVNTVKQAVMEYGSVCCSYYYDTTYLCSTNKAYGYYCPSKKSVNHSSTIVGWDDNFTGYKTTPVDNMGNELKGAWLVKNSWGTTWGNKGYFWLSYYDKTAFSFLVYKTKDASETLNIHSYTSSVPYTFLSSATYGNNNTSTYYDGMSGANVYKAKGNELISSVGYFTVEPCKIQVSIYKNLPEVFDPEYADLVYQSTKYSEPYVGYHTCIIPDTQKVSVLSGEKYAVVVTYSAIQKGFGVFVPFEVAPLKSDGTVDNDSPDRICVNPGETYYAYHDFYRGNRDGSDVWKDVTSSSSTGNAFIYVETECGHMFDAEITKPTCTDSGFTALTCSQCGKVRITDEISALGHSPVTETIEATCTATGSTTTYCSVCGTVISSEQLPVKKHTPVSIPGILPSCTEAGLSEGQYCSECKQTLVEQENIPATGHSFEITVIPETCIASGYTKHTCSVCGYEYTDNSIPASGHSFTETVNPPTSTEQGFTLHKCSYCGYEYTDNYIPATGIITEDNERTEETTLPENSTQVEETTLPENSVHTEETSTPAQTAAAENAPSAEDSTSTEQSQQSEVDKKAEMQDEDSAEGKAEVAGANRLPGNATVSISSGSVSYKTNVTLTARASNIPSGYYVAIFEGEKQLARGDNQSVSYCVGPMTNTRSFTAKIVDVDGAVQEDESGNAIEKSSTVSVDTGFFSRLTAFIKGLFNSLPSETI